MVGMRGMRCLLLVCKVCTHSHWYEVVSAVLKCRFINMGILRLICRGMQSMRYATPAPAHTHTHTKGDEPLAHSLKELAFSLNVMIF